MTKENSSFDLLSKINVESFVRGKNGFKYLSWSHAVNELLRHCPDSSWDYREWDGLPYLQTEAGCFVEVTVTVGEISRKQLHPILDYKNQPIQKPNAFQVNTSLQRALAKAIALHGLGLYIYSGEDLPTNQTEELRGELRELLREAGKINSEADRAINRMNISDLEKKVKEYKEKK